MALSFRPPLKTPTMRSITPISSCTNFFCETVNSRGLQSCLIETENQTKRLWSSSTPGIHLARGEQIGSSTQMIVRGGMSVCVCFQWVCMRLGVLFWGFACVYQGLPCYSTRMLWNLSYRGHLEIVKTFELGARQKRRTWTLELIEIVGEKRGLATQQSSCAPHLPTAFSRAYTMGPAYKVSVGTS